MKEILLRFQAKTNTFWRRAFAIFLSIAAVAGTITEALPLIANDALVPDEWKSYIRVAYGICLGISIAAKLTKADPIQLEFEDKLKEAKAKTE